METDKEFRKKLERTPAQCSECGKESDSIKSYTLPDITFAFFAYRWGYEHHICCASCMRKKILMSALTGIIKTNVLWPIVCFPRLSVNLTRTFVKGHSEDVINHLQTQIQQQWK